MMHFELTVHCQGEDCGTASGTATGLSLSELAENFAEQVRGWTFVTSGGFRLIEVSRFTELMLGWWCAQALCPECASSNPSKFCGNLTRTVSMKPPGHEDECDS